MFRNMCQKNSRVVLFGPNEDPVNNPGENYQSEQEIDYAKFGNLMALKFVVLPW